MNNDDELSIMEMTPTTYRSWRDTAAELTRAEAKERTILRRRIMKDYGAEAYERSVGLKTAESLRAYEQELRDRAVEIAKERERGLTNPRWGQF